MDSLHRHTDYGSVALSEDEIDSHPLDQFARWLTSAEQAGIYEPNGMVLSTVDAQSRPSSRTVLLKGLDRSGFEFVTNYESAKGRELDDNSQVALLFPWYALNRQVIVLGSASHSSADTSDRHFASRPRESQLASLASRQSQPIASRAELEQRVAIITDEHEGTASIPRPPWWGAIRVVPRSVEFWQGRSSRMHDRLRYSRASDDSWMIERLQP
ncbi:MAG: pyridoxamine 5'-phosphate oxidase [Rhodoglobus sp.]